MSVLPDPNAPPTAPGTALPAHTLAQAFHLGQLSAVRGALKDLNEALLRIPEAQATEELRIEWATVVQECWQRYVRATGATEQERKALEAAGLPTRIGMDPNEEAPVAVWPEAAQALTDAWGLFVVPPTDPASQTPLRIAALFQPIDPTSLPAGTHCLLMRDARHTAIAALEHVLGCQVGDTARQREGVADRAGWARLHSLGSWYSQAARAAVTQLPRDQLRDWTDVPASLLATTDLIEGARLIEQHGHTVLALKALALQLAAAQFRQCLDAAERSHPRDLAAAADAVQVAVNGLHGLLVQQLDGLNRGCALASGRDPDAVDVRVIFAPNTHALPQLALIPRSARIPPTPLYPD